MRQGGGEVVWVKQWNVCAYAFVCIHMCVYMFV